MQAFFHLMRTDLRRLLKTPSVPLLWLALPIGLSVIEYGAFGKIGSTPSGLPKGTLLVVDQDRSVAAGFFVQALQREPMSDFMEVVKSDTTESYEKKLTNNDASAVLVVPSGFQDSILAGGRVSLTYIPNPRQEIRPKMIDASLRTFLEIGNRFLHEARDALALLRPRMAADETPSRADVLMMTGAFYDAGQRFEKMGELQNLDIKVQRPARKSGSVATSGDAVNFFAYFLPGLLLFSLLMVAQGFERRQFVLRERGLARRITASPVRTGVVLAAHAGGVLCAALITGGVILALGKLFFHIQLRQPAVIATALVGFALYAVGLMKALYGAARTKRAAETLGSVVVLLSTLIGGGFAPIEIYATGVRPFASATPVGCASTSLVNAIVHGQSFAETGAYVGGTWLWALALCTLGMTLSWRSHARR